MKAHTYILFLFAVCFVSCKALAQMTDVKVHDPVMIKEGNAYHVFCTGPGISHFTSTDMKHWTKVAQVFSEKPTWVPQVVSEFKNHIWAPDVVFHNNLYYLYYSVSAFGKNTSAIGVTTNKTLDVNAAAYHWTDHGIVIQSQPGRDLWNAIDPNIAFDERGNPWMTFGSFWEGMKLVKLNADLLSIAQPQEWTTIARRERRFDLTDENPGNAAIEAPFIFKKNGYYYLFVSWDYCCKGKESTYKVVMGRSKDIKGPYLDKEGKSLYDGGGTLLLEGTDKYNGAGHCSVYTVDAKDYVFFHAYDAADEGKSKLKISEIQWDENLWPIKILQY